MLITDNGLQIIDDVEMLFQKPRVKKIIFNPPATVVIWEDGTKTIVKCTENDEYDAEKGLALCYMKRVCGSEYGRILRNETAKYKRKLVVEVKARLMEAVQKMKEACGGFD